MLGKNQNNKNNFNYPLVIMISLVSLVAIGFYSIGYMKYLRQIEKDVYGKDIKQKYNNKVNKNNKKISGNNNFDSSTDNLSINTVDASANNIKIMDTTNCKLIIVDLYNNKRTEENSKVPKYFVGLTRQQLDKYYDDYMQNIPVEEVEKGIQTVNIIKFSKDEIEIEKIYDESSVRYYILDREGYIKVYYGDKKTIYENTGIETKNLPDVEKKNLEAGICVDDKDELLSILEGYSS